jgi:hypothetical protein
VGFEFQLECQWHSSGVFTRRILYFFLRRKEKCSKSHYPYQKTERVRWGWLGFLFVGFEL